MKSPFLAPVVKPSLFDLQRFAIQAADGMASFDVAANLKMEDISPLLAAALYNEPRLIGEIASGDAVNETEFAWIEDKLNPISVVAAGAIDALDTTVALNVVVGTGKYVRVGTLLKDKAAGSTEVILVTGVVGDALTIVRGYGSTSAEAHGAAAEFLMVGKPLQENSGQTDFVWTERGRNNNFTQIFERTINLSRNVILQGELAVDNEFNHQLQAKTVELTREFNLALIYGIKSATSGSDTELRTTGGILEFLRQAGANHSAAALAFTGTVLNDMFQACYDKGGTPNLIAVGSTLNRKIQALDADKIRIDRADRGVGRFITYFRNEVDGREVPIVVDNDIPVDAVALLDKSRIKRRPFKNSNFISIPGASGADGQSRRILSEWGLEVRNALEAHALYENLS